MRYFAWHELVYQRLIASGATTWDRTSFDDYELRPLVAKVSQQWLRPGQRVLVLGCGTGPDACHFAVASMRVTGIDISPTAIDLAKKQAADRGLDVTWIVGDACDLSRAGRFDVVAWPLVHASSHFKTLRGLKPTLRTRIACLSLGGRSSC